MTNETAKALKAQQAKYLAMYSEQLEAQAAAIAKLIAIVSA